MGKRKWVFISSVGLLAVLIGQGIYADFKAGDDNAVPSEPVHQAPSVPVPARSAYNTGSNPGLNAGSSPAYSPNLADGDGKEDVAYNCSLCHGLSYITARPPISAQAWEREVNMMRGFYGASISDSTAKKIVQYLGSHYTPETMKR